jgi:hypothetical protein
MLLKVQPVAASVAADVLTVALERPVAAVDGDTCFSI